MRDSGVGGAPTGIGGTRKCRALHLGECGERAQSASTIATIYVVGVTGGAQARIPPVPECLFCRIVSGGVPASRVLESPRTLSFRDISPQAPTHVLVIPKDHYPDLAALAAADGSLLTELISQVDEVAKAEGISSSGYRVVFNTGTDAGQAVPHVHAHVLGRRGLSWPPG